MHVPTAFKSSGNAAKAVAIVLIGTIAAAVAVLVATVPPVTTAMQAVDMALYDAFFKQRPTESRQGGPVMIIAVDQSSIDRMAASELKHRWEWPREVWGALLGYLQRAGSRAVAVDLLFEEPSRYNYELGDDNTFATQIDALSIPIVYAAQLSKSTDATRFAPPVARPPRLGAVDVIDDAVVRRYKPFVNDQPSFAVETVRAAGGAIPDWANQPFLIHYYGPTRHANGTDTYKYIPAFDVLTAMVSPDGEAGPISPEMFKDKIVVIGTTAAATFDLKSSPVSAIYPSVEAQATAIDNLLQGRRVIPIGWTMQIAIAWLGAMLATAGAMLPRPVWMKIILSLAAVAAVFAAGYVLFARGASIYWLALCIPLLATGLATVIGLAWSYLVEDRRRRAMLKFLSQYVSPHVAAELSRQDELSLVGQRREMTVMFTDIAGFTQLADRLPVDKLEQFMSLYLNEMSGGVFDFDGTLDKYIGDAIMCFWNAPMDQPEHAVLACRAALRLREREKALQVKFGEFGIGRMHTRIGINSGLMVVGNVGSEKKVNYTVIGDSVNLGSRLEGGNKIYGSQILVAESTVQKAGDKFLFRKLDLLRVRGRSQPLIVYELLGEAPADERLSRLARQYETAFEHYQNRDWDSAEIALVDLIGEFADDGPSAALLKRARKFRDQPPGADWDGAHDM